ncbi:hypothetical protein DICVIV_12363 [Dictyocaulus viviparus]|uniref:Uncharacterized protein n=1 Tax=Dictyocaulus viviparus TaxID=29172 RepID=A0A0D8XH36_DICVI|nr:hypothetical protein DICVIV_12363 [Dictyocaulus viviparus]
MELDFILTYADSQHHELQSVLVDFVRCAVQAHEISGLSHKEGIWFDISQINLDDPKKHSDSNFEVLQTWIDQIMSGSITLEVKKSIHFSDDDDDDEPEPTTPPTPVKGKKGKKEL